MSLSQGPRVIKNALLFLPLFYTFIRLLWTFGVIFLTGKECETKQKYTVLREKHLILMYLSCIVWTCMGFYFFKSRWFIGSYLSRLLFLFGVSMDTVGAKLCCLEKEKSVPERMLKGKRRNKQFCLDSWSYRYKYLTYRHHLDKKIKPNTFQPWKYDKSFPCSW